MNIFKWKLYLSSNCLENILSKLYTIELQINYNKKTYGSDDYLYYYMIIKES